MVSSAVDAWKGTIFIIIILVFFVSLCVLIALRKGIVPLVFKDILLTMGYVVHVHKTA